MKLMPNLLGKRASEKKRNRPSEKGQTEVEFMLVLPFFLAVVFGLLSFVMLVFKGQMLTYATYMAARVAAVKHPFNAIGDAQYAARQILPEVNISNGSLFPMLPLSGEMIIRGSYRVDPLSRAVDRSSLDAGMSKGLNVKADVRMHHFQSPRLTAELLWNMSDGVAKDDNVYTLY